MLKSEAVVRANIHSCLKADALRWYSQELTSDEKRLMNEVSLESGWFAMMTKRFKPNRTDALLELDTHVYTWNDVRTGRTPREYAQGMLRLLKSTGYTATLDQLLRIRQNIDPSLRRDIDEPTETTTLAKFMESLDARYQDWKDLANRSTRYQSMQGFQAPRPNRDRPQSRGGRGYQSQRESYNYPQYQGYQQHQPQGYQGY